MIVCFFVNCIYQLFIWDGIFQNIGLVPLVFGVYIFG